MAELWIGLVIAGSILFVIWLVGSEVQASRRQKTIGVPEPGSAVIQSTREPIRGGDATITVIGEWGHPVDVPHEYRTVKGRREWE